MSCEDFDRKLDDWLDGVLLEADALQLAGHAEACAACAARLRDARELKRLAAALPREIRPARDLWPDIAARLEDADATVPVHRRPWFRAVAAGLVLAGVFASGMLADRVLRETGEDTQIRSVQREKALPGVREARRFLPASHVELIEGNGGLDGAGVDTGTEQALLRNLLLVNLAIREVETAALEDPSNANLRELLSGLYAQENRILGQAERLRATRQAPTRIGI